MISRIILKHSEQKFCFITCKKFFLFDYMQAPECLNIQFNETRSQKINRHWRSIEALILKTRRVAVTENVIVAAHTGCPQSLLDCSAHVTIPLETLPATTARFLSAVAARHRPLIIYHQLPSVIFHLSRQTCRPGRLRFYWSHVSKVAGYPCQQQLFDWLASRLLDFKVVMLQFSSH